METIDFTPLGFSDLSSDEAFVVSVFRHWRSSDTTRNEAESDLAGMLENDRLCDGLQLLFDLFGTLPDQHGRKTKNHRSVLTPVEEALLDEIGSTDTIYQGAASKRSSRCWKTQVRQFVQHRRSLGLATTTLWR